MNANEMTFGIEIETTIPGGVLEVGSYTHGIQVSQLPAGWVAKYDGSIRSVRGRRGCEFVSPVLRGVDGLQQVRQVCEFLSQIGARVNASCGLHVHVGFDRSNLPALERLVTLVANYETAIYASTGTHSRERNQFCRPVSPLATPANAIQSQHRYRIVNLTSPKPTVEFRAFAGTTNFQKIVGYVRLCVGLVERAITAPRKTKWVPVQPVQTSPVHRSGTGQTHLTRAYYMLGWIKGRQPHTFGAILDPSLPSLQSTRRTLMGMARKYDQSA